ncbi:hypothetical protein Ndes2526B_g00555 [Nannochloris sp. 'desiccata']|nr:putative Baculoviral IAP repeat-containing protein 6 [Chlorella desiccata (nom. nud.)]
MSENIMIISDEEDEFLQQDPLTAWTCPHCTVENQATYLACDCCGQERLSDQIATIGVNNTYHPPPQRGGATPPLFLLDSQPTQQIAAPIIKNGSETWTCSACTFINSSLSLDCDVCGTPGIAVEPDGSRSYRQQQQEEDFSNFPAPPALNIPMNYDFNHRNNNEDSSQKVYDLDCGCCGPFKEIKEAVRVAVVTLPSAPSLLCLLRHFSCPANVTSSNIVITAAAAVAKVQGISSRCNDYKSNTNGTSCTRQLSGRDLKALLGAKTAAAIDRGFYSAAVAAVSTTGARGANALRIDDGSGASSSRPSPCAQLTQHCMHLAASLSQLYSAMTTTDTDTASKSRGTSRFSKTVMNSPDNGSNRNSQHQQTRRTAPAVVAGVGYGGGQGEDTHHHRQLKEQAAARQRTTDAEIALTLRNIREIVHHLLRAEENFVFKEISPLGWLPLGAVGILNGSPLAACLRLLLCNDSLMDVTERREVYSEALQLVSMLASKEELIPMLLVPADGDILAEFCRSSPAGFPSSLEGNTRDNHQRQQNKHQLAGNREEKVEKDGQRSSKRAKTGAGASLASTEKKEEEDEVELSFEAGLERSCWKALQAFTLQCKLFMRSAEQLAGDGSEDDVSTVGTVLLVQETCTAVDEAVSAWKLTHTREHNNETIDALGGAADCAGPSGSARQNKKKTAAAAATILQQEHQDTNLKQHYIKSMKGIAFRSINLVEGGDYYFRNQLNTPDGQIQGDRNARLRRVMRDIASLSTDLPIDWNSSILVVNDETRMDAFRAVIFPPEESPYANGAFFFDILLPPEYPSSPPKVQFLTTGGGRVRFNPNLYDSGKVCLSLLGTWSGPSWDPKESSLLQVVVSIQAMILGESNPYGNEPGFACQLNTAAGKLASDAYNRSQRYNTIKYSMLPAVQAVMALQPKSSSGAAGAARGTIGAGALGAPKGFDEALKWHFKLKSSEIQRQLHQWKQENASFNAPVATTQRGGGRNKNNNDNASIELLRAQGGGAIPENTMEDAVNSVVALIDQIVI